MPALGLKSQELPERWPPGKTAYDTLDQFNRTLEQVLTDLNSRIKDTVSVDPSSEYLAQLERERFNRSAQIYNASLDSVEAQLTPMKDLSTGDFIKDFPRTIYLINELDIETMRSILSSLGVRPEHIAVDEDAIVLSGRSSMNGRAIMAERKPVAGGASHSSREQCADATPLNNGFDDSNGCDPVAEPVAVPTNKPSIKRQTLQLRRQVRLALGLVASYSV